MKDNNSNSPIIEVRNLKKYFPITAGILRRPVAQVKAVDGISFQIRRGQALALAGESGCGKTTTARTLLLLERPTAGEILWEGRDIAHLSHDDRKAYRQTTQAVFQDPTSSLNPRMRIKDIISEPMKINEKLSDAEITKRVSELLTSVGLQPTDAALYPHEFSGGQRQRIAIARALGPKPKIIILDEPVSSIDVSMRSGIMNLLKDLAKTYEISYLIIAHDFSTIRYMSHEIAIMYLGKIVEQSGSSEVCSNPLHPYTQGLIASSVVGKPGEGFKIIIKGEVASPINPPPGCSFHPRCPVAFDLCPEALPAFEEVLPGHKVACHLYTGKNKTQVHAVREKIAKAT